MRRQIMNSRKVLRSILGGFVIVSLLVVSGCGLKTENDQLKKVSADLKAQVGSLTTEADSLKKQIQDLKSDNESLKKENKALKARAVPTKKAAPGKKIKKI
jgi:cell division protein FtsB